jgi:hypothetical protein
MIYPVPPELRSAMNNNRSGRNPLAGALWQIAEYDR